MSGCAINHPQESGKDIVMVPANCFIYKTFNSSELEQKAKSTRSNFLNFVRHTFEKILAQGSALWEFKSELLVHLGSQEGKAVFEAWLDSEEFGASRYIAHSAMQLSAWYNTLPAALLNQQMMKKERGNNLRRNRNRLIFQVMAE